ncbi:MAG TPA: electron transfer flavoprotein subunit alpha/FixB family protein [Bryobacteraceae bacterium]|nr:electron transfer flavoprotein subunit alpha/FixB family protein [Bryobacteraceae bacterium]
MSNAMSGGILVVAEQRGGAWNRMSWETLVAGQQLAEKTGQAISAAVAGQGIAALAGELARKKLDRVYAIEHPLLASYTADGYTAALEQLLRKVNPSIVLFPHTYQVRDFAPKLGTRFNQVLISDAIGFRVESGAPIFVRQLFQGKLNADVKPGGAEPYFASIQAGAFRADQLAEGSAQMENFGPDLNAEAIRAKPLDPFRESARAVDLTAADIIVSVGRGIKEKENIPIVEELAKALGAELAASRPICDSGWLPMERQVGSSGQTVSPKVYLAVGISGAIQHLVGMKGAKTIVAINKDANAPIFEVADYGIVGDLFEVVPALVEEVKKAKG